MSPVKVPKYPPIILTPSFTHFSLSEQTLKLIELAVNSTLKSTETYSITFSPVLCPEGRNWLYTLKPYYWEISPGHWGQKQLESLCMAIRNLALGVRYLSKLAEEARERAEQLIRVFFIHHETRMNPEVWYSQCIPGQLPLQGDDCFVISCRFLILISQSAGLLNLSQEVEGNLREWFKAHLDWIITSEQGARARTKGNNISIWYHALVSSHLVYLNPGERVTYPSEFLDECMTEYPDPHSFFARELERTRPRHYTLFVLESLFLIVGATDDTPSHRILGFLESLVTYAKHVQPGEIEIEVDNDVRYLNKLRWFEKMLDRWNRHEVKEKLDGTPWEGGWNMSAKISWGLL